MHHVTHVVLQVRVDAAIQQDPGTFIVAVLCPQVERCEARLKHALTFIVIVSLMFGEA